MAQWIELGRTDEFPEGTHVCTTAGDKPIVIIRTGDDVHAIANVCPHAGKAIGQGEVRGHVITCPFHGFAYDVRSGRNVDFPYDEPPVRTYPARVVNGRIQVQIEM